MADTARGAVTNEILLPCLVHKWGSTLPEPTSLAAPILEDAVVGFEVDPDDLDAFSKQLGRASDDVHSALDYMQKECTIGPFDRGPLSEIASMFKTGHEEVFSSAKSTLKKLEKILDTSKREMSQSAKYYAATDRSEASRVDATYPAASGGASGHNIPGQRAKAGKSTFNDVTQPTERLVPPTVDSEADEPTMAYRELTKYGDPLSPSWVASKGIEIFCSWFGLEFNPIDEAKKVLAGNWEEYAECAEAWAALGKFCDDLAGNIGAGNRALNDSWSGNAAAGAHVYFEKLTNDVADMKESFDSLKEQYEALTEAVWHAAEASGDILSGMLDLALIIGLTAAAGASTSWTLVGPVIAGGAIAGELAMMATLYAKFTAVISTVQTVVSGSTGAVVQVNRLVEAKMVKFPLPRSGYDNPAV